MDLLLGGTAAAVAGAICNPLEVIKIRMQLQGELKTKGNYSVFYRNVFHAGYVITTKEGFLALQKGVVPFAMYQFAANSARLGLFQICSTRGMTKNSDGTVNSFKTLACALVAGGIGGVLCSPFFLVKTHLQSKANEISIAVGHQHGYTGTIAGFRSIYQKYGIFGLWRGISTMVPRIAVANAGQLLTFEKAHELMKREFPERPWISLISACLTAGLFMSLSIAPFDLVATRFYNQGTNAKGKGLFYNSFLDCVVKVHRKEGTLGFFKGWTACYFRVGPYTLILLVVWDRMKHYHNSWKLKYGGGVSEDSGIKC